MAKLLLSHAENMIRFHKIDFREEKYVCEEKGTVVACVTEMTEPKLVDLVRRTFLILFRSS